MSRNSWYRRDLWWKVMSVVVAMALWLIVAGEPDVSTSVVVPLQVLNVPSNLVIASNPPAQVRLSVRGPAGRVTPRDLANVAVMVDLANARPGERIVPVDASNVTLPQGVAIERAQPPDLEFRLEQVVRRPIPIRLRVAKPPAADMELEATEIVPPELPATGPESNMRNILEAETEPLDLSGLQGNTTLPAHAIVSDSAVRFEGGSRVQVKVTLRKRDR